MLAFGNVLTSIGNDLQPPVADQPVRDKPSDNSERKKIQETPGWLPLAVRRT